MRISLCCFSNLQQVITFLSALFYDCAFKYPFFKKKKELAVNI